MSDSDSDSEVHGSSNGESDFEGFSAADVRKAAAASARGRRAAKPSTSTAVPMDTDDSSDESPSDKSDTSTDEYELPSVSPPVTRARARVQRGARGGAAVRPGGGWMRVADEDQHAVPHPFAIRGATGPRQLPARNSTLITYFLLLFTTATTRTVLRNTLAYGEATLHDLAGWIVDHPTSRMSRWKMADVTLKSLKQYLGLCICMGITRKKNVKDYWSRRNPSQITPYFGRVMSYRRFAMIQWVFHVGFQDPAPRGHVNFDPWNKMRPVLDAMNKTFKTYFLPHRCVSIDESMVGMRNRVAYIQYLPNKRHSRFGIKKFELCDASSGYVIHVELYAGKDFPIESDMGQAHGVVMDLMRKSDLLNKGYHLFTDNYYTKPALAEVLCGDGTLLTGTVRANSKGLPVLPTKLQVGQCLNFRRKDTLVVAFREKRKPKCVVDYNRYMVGVDLSDRKIYHVSAERPSRRYWKKIFFNLMDMALLNSFELYYSNTDGRRRKTRYDFICSVLESLCGVNGVGEAAAAEAAAQPAAPAAQPAAAPAAQPDVAQPAVPEGHQLQHLPGKQERDCVVCSDRSRGIRKRSSYWCAGCGSGVHKHCFCNLVHKNPRV
ncbi:hypothetical protein LSAT2_029928 [Lamellibrachia satsuma]|nr:hypothetical protein LSAT2_029928 [Lamellibrachia satsuma]